MRGQNRINNRYLIDNYNNIPKALSQLIDNCHYFGKKFFPGFLIKFIL